MSEKIPKVAVITRTKDRGILLERAIKSVHQQTMRNFVHVIINDAGDPKVVDELVKKYAREIDGRVKVIHNRVSRGMEAASNKAIKSVNSTYVAIHDDDDTWHPDFLKETTERLDENGMKGVIVTTDKVIEKIDNGVIEVIETERYRPETKSINIYNMCMDNRAVPITFLFRREMFGLIGYYDEDLKVCGDWDFALRFLRHFDIDFLATDYALAYYHHRPTAKGAAGNSVFVNNDRHEYYRSFLANKYLREDIAGNGLGLGYLFSERQSAKIEQKAEFKKLRQIMERLDMLEETVLRQTSIRRFLGGVSRLPRRATRKVVKAFQENK